MAAHLAAKSVAPLAVLLAVSSVAQSAASLDLKQVVTLVELLANLLVADSAELLEIPQASPLVALQVENSADRLVDLLVGRLE